MHCAYQGGRVPARQEQGGNRRYANFNRSLLLLHRSIYRSLLTLTEIVGKAQDIYKKLQMRYNVVYDTSGAIGRRYRRMDEAGTPMCICICTHTHARARAHTHTRTHTHTHTHTHV